MLSRRYAPSFDLPGGRITHDADELVLKTRGEFQTAKQFESLVVATRNGVPIYFKEIGHAEDGMEEERSPAQSALGNCAFDPLHVRLDFAQDNSIFIQHSVDEVYFHLYFGGDYGLFA